MGRVINPILWLLVAAAIAAGLVGQLGRWWPAFDLLNLFRSVWMGLAVAALIILALRRDYRRGIIIALVLLVPAFWRPALPVTKPCASDDGPRIKIVSANLWQDNRDPEAAAAWIVGQKPDVAVLLETKGRAARIPDMLREVLPYRVDCHPRVPCSTMILSRSKPVAEIPLARGDVENRQSLSAVLVKLGEEAGSASVLAVHLSRPLPLGRQGREVEEIARVVRQTGSDHLILAGDFNATTSLFALKTLIPPELGRVATGATWPAGPSGIGVPLLAIDHIFTGRGWRVEAATRGPAIGSDHLPLAATFCATGRG